MCIIRICAAGNGELTVNLQKKIIQKSCCAECTVGFVSYDSLMHFFKMVFDLNRWQYHVIRGSEFIFPQINYCTEGSGTLTVDGKKHIIEPGMAFFLPENYPHEYYSNGDIWDTHWVVPAGFAINDTLQNMGFDKPLIFKLNDMKLVEHHFKKMHEAIIGDKTYGTFRAAARKSPFLQLSLQGFCLLLKADPLLL